MTLEKIQFLMLDYAKQEKKYTIMATVFYVVAIGALLVFLFMTNALDGVWNRFNPNSGGPTFINYIPLMFLVSMIIYVVYRFMELAKTEQKITAFINEIKQQNKIASLNPHIQHKLLIPLGKIRLKFLPIECAVVQFKNKKVYNLPMPQQCIQPLRSINDLGVEAPSSVENTWNQLS